MGNNGPARILTRRTAVMRRLLYCYHQRCLRGVVRPSSRSGCANLGFGRTLATMRAIITHVTW